MLEQLLADVKGYTRQGDHRTALELLRGFYTANEDKLTGKNLFVIFFHLGESHLALGEHTHAIRKFKAAIAAASKDNLRFLRARASLRLGTIYRRLDNYLLAIEYVKSANKVLCQFEKYDPCILAYFELAQAYGQLGNLNLALLNVQLAWAMCDKAENQCPSKKVNLFILLIDIKLRQKVGSEELLELLALAQGLVLTASSLHRGYQALMHLYLGKIHFGLCEYEPAGKAFDQANTLFSEYIPSNGNAAWCLHQSANFIYQWKFAMQVSKFDGLLEQIVEFIHGGRFVSLTSSEQLDVIVGLGLCACQKRSDEYNSFFQRAVKYLPIPQEERQEKLTQCIKLWTSSDALKANFFEKMQIVATGGLGVGEGSAAFTKPGKAEDAKKQKQVTFRLDS